MANITAADVNKLRKMTGAGMMDCKKALQESEGDFEKAIEILRKKGQKVAAKRADKDATEGIVIAKTTSDNKYGIILTVNTETDFVAKGDDFVNYVNKVADLALESRPKSVEELKSLKMDGMTVEENLTDLIGKIGEKMDIPNYGFIEAPLVAGYNHQGNKLATLVGINKDSINAGEQIAREIAMQIAAMNPVAIDKDDVDPAIVEKELEIGKEQALQEGKPEQIVEKIARGKLEKFFKENTLLNQEFVRDTKKTVGKYLKEIDGDLTVTEFKRQMLG
jgi:elongation factor Ts